MPNIIVGLLALSMGLWGMAVWWYSVEEFLRGAVPLLLILFGLVALMAGVSRVKRFDDSAIRREQQLDDIDLMQRSSAREETNDSSKIEGEDR
ncbi:hypothetical protein D5085_13190 [Ectothiorhodospiraceae bacterium BW-2]|nr:hypothetical protein D5085_13190 [Ectothiorhodospiraceae bacterium BW-2]